MHNLTTRNIARACQVALMGVHLNLTDQINNNALNFVNKLVVSMGGVHQADYIFDSLSLYNSIKAIDSLWAAFIEDYNNSFVRAIHDACNIVYDMFAFYHDEVFIPAYKQAGKTESKITISTINESIIKDIFAGLTDELVRAAYQRIYADGLSLSDRIWKLDKESLDEIKRIIYDGAINKRNIQDVANALEIYVRGDTGEGGVSYKALRLARTEIQTIYHEALSRILSKIPFIHKIQVKLSARHIVHDICDDHIEGGENGEGIYKIGEIHLPFHPNCLCYIKPILDNINNLIKRIRIFTFGKKFNISLDEYTKLLGGDLSIIIGNGYQEIFKWLD